MTDITELAQSMKAAAEKATPGEWWSDVVETGGTHGNGDDCMEGFHSYAVYDQNNHSLLDMTNSTSACITVEDDGDYIMAWDEVGRRNAEFIALANPVNVLALVEALERAQRRIAELEAIVNTPVNLPKIGGNDRYAWSDGVFNYRQDVVLALTRHGLAHGLTVQED